MWKEEEWSRDGGGMPIGTKAPLTSQSKREVEDESE